MNDYKDYYQILGVSPKATADEIKKAYRTKARKYHPDNSDIPESKRKYYEDKFKEISEAYEVLGNVRKRREYDIFSGATNYSSNDNNYYNYNNCCNNNDYNYYSQKETSANTEDDIPKYTRHTSFADDLKETYDEIRKEERKKSFVKRHKKINNNIKKVFNYNRDNLGKEIVFNIGGGTIHIFYEALYQLEKLKMIREDGFKKALIRNRVLLTSILCFIIIGNAFGDNLEKDLESDIQYVNEVASNENYEKKEATVILENDVSYPSFITLRRNHTVDVGDTLSQLSEDSGTSIYDLKKLNDLKNDMLYYDSKITIPYKISSDNLQYYTMTVPTNSKSIYDLAIAYETDTETLIKLNEEAISKVDNSYIILTDNIVVPNFITYKELVSKKQQSKNNTL